MSRARLGLLIFLLVVSNFLGTLLGLRRARAVKPECKDERPGNRWIEIHPSRKLEAKPFFMTAVP